jgi:hypothetical protein
MPGDVPHRSDLPERTEEEQRTFFDAALERALLAEQRSGTIRRQFELAGTRIEFVFAGDRLLSQLTGALAHLSEPVDRAPDVTIHVWDSASSGIEMIPPPWRRECFTDRGDIWGMSSRRIRTSFHFYEYSLNLLDLDRRVGIFWVGNEAPLPSWTEGAPFRTLLHWWMEENGAQVMHAAAAGTPEGAVLVTGKGGIGKSTTALACLAAGMQYVGDDYVVVTLDPAPRVYSLYSTAKLDTRAMERFPQFRGLVTNPDVAANEKTILQLFPRLGDQVQRWLPLKAVTTPSFGNEPGTTASPVSRDVLQRAAEFTTLSQLPHAGRATHAFIHRMLCAVPNLQLTLGHDVDRVPDAIARIVALDLAALTRLATSADDAEASARRPLLSVIIPVFNGTEFLAHAIRNVLSQNYPGVEIIVVDDGSVDDLAAAVRALPVPVRFFEQPNGGAASARNRGIRDASGELLAFLDVDDLWPPGTLLRLADVLVASPDIDVVHGRVQLARFTTYEDHGEYVGSPTETFRYSIAAGVYRRRAFERVGLFDRALRYGEDSDWFLRGKELGLRIIELDEIVLIARRHEGNMTRGKSLAELQPLQLFKNVLDRRRSAQAVARAPQG